MSFVGFWTYNIELSSPNSPDVVCEDNQSTDLVNASLNFISPKVNKIDGKESALNKLLAIRPSSISVERFFSTCSGIVVPMRSKINTDYLNAILICNKF